MVDVCRLALVEDINKSLEAFYQYNDDEILAKVSISCTKRSRILYYIKYNYSEQILMMYYREIKTKRLSSKTKMAFRDEDKILDIILE